MPEQERLSESNAFKSPPRLSFGGSLLKRSHAKTPRVLSSKQALHIVLRSEAAKGHRSFLRNERLLQNLILKQGRRHGVKVYQVSNGGNHLHILVRFTQRRGLQNFLRSICGIIARKTLQKERGISNNSPQATSNESCNQSWLGKFWDQRPFTHLVKWGPAFKALQNYFKLPQTEALGFVLRKQVEQWGSDQIRKRILTRLSLALA